MKGLLRLMIRTLMDLKGAAQAVNEAETPEEMERMMKEVA